MSSVEQLEERIRVPIPFRQYGIFDMLLFRGQQDPSEHLALVKAPQKGNQIPLVRIHSECITGDVFGSCKCDCGPQLDYAMENIAREGGVLIYLRQEGRGIGLENKLKAYALQAKGLDTVDANLALGLPVDDRNYTVAFQILQHLGLNTIRLITNNPDKINAMEQLGITVQASISNTFFTDDNKHYLETKRDRLGHFLEVNQ